jgi:hypothetical protein
MLVAGCSGGSDEESDGTVGEVDEPLPIRVIVRPNPAAADPSAGLELRTVPADESTPEIIHEQPMSTRDVKAEIDVRGVDGLDLLINGDLAVAIPRHFWENTNRGRLIIRIRPGGVRLERSSERWYVPHPLWEMIEPATVAVVVRLVGVDPDSDVPIELRSDDPAGPVLAATSTANNRHRWAQTVEVDAESALIAVFGDHYVELPPDLWQLAWDTVEIEFRDDVATYKYKWPFSPREIDQVREPLVVEPLP